MDGSFELALVLANEAGHRVGAIRQLRWTDVDFQEKRILWREENDKIGMEHSPPLSEEAVRVLEQSRRKRGSIGDGCSRIRTIHRNRVRRHLLRDWWRRAEKLAANICRVPGAHWSTASARWRSARTSRPLYRRSIPSAYHSGTSRDRTDRPFRRARLSGGCSKLVSDQSGERLTRNS